MYGNFSGEILPESGGISNRRADQFFFAVNSLFVRYADMQYDSGCNVLSVWTNNSVPIRSPAPFGITTH
jgi:hypothetical protein